MENASDVDTQSRRLERFCAAAHCASILHSPGGQLALLSACHDRCLREGSHGTQLPRPEIAERSACVHTRPARRHRERLGRVELDRQMPVAPLDAPANECKHRARHVWDADATAAHGVRRSRTRPLFPPWPELAALASCPKSQRMPLVHVNVFHIYRTCGSGWMTPHLLR